MKLKPIWNAEKFVEKILINKTWKSIDAFTFIFISCFGSHERFNLKAILTMHILLTWRFKVYAQAQAQAQAKSNLEPLKFQHPVLNWNYKNIMSWIFFSFFFIKSLRPLHLEIFILKKYICNIFWWKELL